MKKVFVRSAYNYDMDEATNETALGDFDKSKTRQEFKDEADINNIVRRFGLTGELPKNVRMPTYGDFTGLADFHQAMNAVVAAEESFDRMPADVRARFHNNPAEFVDFCSDEKNADEAKKLGLVHPKDLPPPDPQLIALEAIRDRLPAPEETAAPPKGGKTGSQGKPVS